MLPDNPTSWTRAQQRRLAKLLPLNDSPDVWLGFWCSDQHGRPANGGTGGPVSVGQEQTLTGDLEICTANALHGTREPHRWAGCRVWIVALHGKREEHSDKAGALRREVIGEVTPLDCIDPRIAVKIGDKLDCLDGASLVGARLDRASLVGARLDGASLVGASLVGARLDRASLVGASLVGASLVGASVGDDGIIRKE